MSEPEELTPAQMVLLAKHNHDYHMREALARDEEHISLSGDDMVVSFEKLRPEMRLVAAVTTARMYKAGRIADEVMTAFKADTPLTDEQAVELMSKEPS